MNTIRTSETHPLQIANISSHLTKGIIGVTLCPGKFDEVAMTGAWDRDLGLDLDEIVNWGAKAVVTLLEQKELSLLRVEQLGAEVIHRKLLWFHLPIIDVSIPDKNFERNWSDACFKLIQLLRNGSNILLHCRGGLGRAGTIAARLLVEVGTEPNLAIEQVRRARPGAIETKEQEKYILNINLNS
jgi:ADP-ribosyl-[dinitrogen reductase] hydrolase